MIFLGYFLDELFSKVLIGTYFLPMLFLVFSMFSYFNHRNLDSFFIKIGISSFFAFLFFGRNFLLDTSYFLLFYVAFSSFFTKYVGKKKMLFSLFCLICGYYFYMEVYLFCLQKPHSLFFLLKTILQSLPFNFIVLFCISFLFGLKKRKREYK